MNGRNGHHDRNISGHVSCQFFLPYLMEICTSGNQLCHQNLLVNALHEHFFIDRLVFPSNKVVVQVHIKIKNIFYKGQRLIRKNIVYIEGMLRQLHTAFAQHFCFENQRMHNQILCWQKTPNFMPVAQTAGLKHIAVMNLLLSAFVQMVIYVIAYKHIHRCLVDPPFFHAFQHFL